MFCSWNNHFVVFFPSKVTVYQDLCVTFKTLFVCLSLEIRVTLPFNEISKQIQIQSNIFKILFSYFSRSCFPNARLDKMLNTFTLITLLLGLDNNRLLWSITTIDQVRRNLRSLSLIMVHLALAKQWLLFTQDACTKVPECVGDLDETLPNNV